MQKEFRSSRTECADRRIKRERRAPRRERKGEPQESFRPFPNRGPNRSERPVTPDSAPPSSSQIVRSVGVPLKILDISELKESEASRPQTNCRIPTTVITIPINLDIVFPFSSFSPDVGMYDSVVDG
jgi:hypothetical protein